MSSHSPPRIPNSHHKSDLDTRLPTSSKKKRPHSPFKHLPPSRINPRFLPETILAMESQKQKCMSRRKYSWAQSLDRNIRRAKSQLAASRVSQLLEQQREEKRSISQAHKTQMKYFRYTWGDYFSRLQERQSQILRCFKQEQERQVFEAQMKVRRKCRSLHSGSAEIIQLARKEALLREQQDFAYLKHVRRQLAEAVLKQRRRRQSAIERLAEVEEERLSIIQSKKYAVLVRRLEEYRKDKERVYLRQQKRLRQKYRNVIHQLKHEQTMELQQGSRIYLEHPY